MIRTGRIAAVNLEIRMARIKRDELLKLVELPETVKPQGSPNWKVANR